jgi:hypothetical protein
MFQLSLPYASKRAPAHSGNRKILRDRFDFPSGAFSFNVLRFKAPTFKRRDKKFFEESRSVLRRCGFVLSIVRCSKSFCKAHAQAGWFTSRSWSYWHYRLGLVDPGGRFRHCPSACCRDAVCASATCAAP